MPYRLVTAEQIVCANAYKPAMHISIKLKSKRIQWTPPEPMGPDWGGLWIIAAPARAVLKVVAVAVAVLLWPLVKLSNLDGGPPATV